jgi:hypothetical protein
MGALLILIHNPLHKDFGMTKQYRIEIETFWQHPKLQFGKSREQFYDFTTGTLVPDERSWFDGQDFYDPKRSPHIYAGKDQAEAVYDEMSSDPESWEPLKDIVFEGSNENVMSYRMISIDENGDETVEAELNVCELLAMPNETVNLLSVRTAS